MAIPIIDPAEPPRERARRHLVSLAHRALSEVVDALLRPEGGPVSATAACRRSGVRVVVRLLPFGGPTWEPSGPAPGPRLTSQQRQIVAACNRAEPTTAKRIARALGKRDVSSYLREQLRRLVGSGVLRRSGGGYLRE